jgi:outer membrane protein assembly factor BamB
VRFQRSAAIATAAVLLWAVGPLVLLLCLGLLAVPRMRRWLRPTWRVVAAWVGTVAVLVGVVVLVPDGHLPIPPGVGALTAPRYTGRPATPKPITLEVPQHPRLAANGLSSMHNDGWATDAYAGPGPLGESPQVDTAWYGVEECATLAFDSRERLVALCGSISGPALHVLDPDSMRPRATMELPGRRDNGNGKRPWEDPCGGAYFFLDDQDRAVVATTERSVVVVTTADGDGEPDLTVHATYDLSEQVPEDDCLVALMPDWEGRTWYATEDGRVGFVDPGTGRATVLELGEEIANSFSVAKEGVYVVTSHALYQLGADRARRPVVRWRTPYDRGTQVKPGQLSRGSGTTPTVLPGGLVAIADNAEPRMNVQFYDTGSGDLVCQRAVFADGASATDNSLVAVGDGVVVENNHGYRNPLSTLLGFTPEGGLARVDVAGGDCELVWTSEAIAPTSVAKVSLANGLVYAYAKRSSRLGVNAWYFTALDAGTGRTVWSVRTGIGTMFNNHYSAVTLGPDGSAYVATLAGLVRVRDRS